MRLRFANVGKGTSATAGPEPARTHVSSARTMSDAFADLNQDDAVFAAAFPEVRWRYYNPGDYDQNGEVGISDLVPLATHFAAGSNQQGFPVTSIESVVDGDGNGEINLADLTVIGRNLGYSALGGFKVFASARSVIHDNDPPPEFEVGGIAFADAMVVDRATERALCRFIAPTDREELLGKWFYILIEDADTDPNSDLLRTVVPWPPGTHGDLLFLSHSDWPSSLSWLYFNQCDGYQDGQVDWRDPATVGDNYGTVWFDQSAPKDDLLYLLDYDLNGEINIADLTPIGIMMGRRVMGYNLYAAANLDAYPDTEMALSSITPIGDVPFTVDPAAPPETVRHGFSFNLPAISNPTYFWVRPVGPGGYEGIASDAVFVDYP
jgi:hypothetical protein